MTHVSDILSSISVLLVFLTILVTYLSTELRSAIEDPKPDKSQTKARRKAVAKLRFTLLAKAIPITIVFIIITYTLLPQTVEILKSSRISLWNFDSLSTIFIIIEVGLLGFTSYSFAQTIRLIRKLMKN